jgi:hypothetical protein
VGCSSHQHHDYRKEKKSIFRILITSFNSSRGQKYPNLRALQSVENKKRELESSDPVYLTMTSIAQTTACLVSTISNFKDLERQKVKSDDGRGLEMQRLNITFKVCLDYAACVML